MLNATVNYTTRNGKYIKQGNIVFYSCQLRGTISAVDDPPYARITGLPFDVVYPGSADSIREYANCLQYDTYHPTVGVNKDTTVGTYIGIQNTSTGKGTSSNRWKTTSSTFYLFISGFYFIA